MFDFLSAHEGFFWHKAPSLGFSGPQTDHLLWQQGNLWLMDNHRLALWCWMQEWQGAVNFLHLDAHYDCAPLKQAFEGELRPLSLEQYRSLKNGDGEALFQWDNYLTHFQQHHHHDLINNIFFTHHVGLPGRMDKHYDVWELIPMLDQFFGHPEPWIVNLDLDYFYSRKWKGAPLIHATAIAEVARLLREASDEGRIRCLTLAMSPECVGGWDEAKRIAGDFLRAYNKH